MHTFKATVIWPRYTNGTFYLCRILYSIFFIFDILKFFTFSLIDNDAHSIIISNCDGYCNRIECFLSYISKLHWTIMHWDTLASHKSLVFAIHGYKLISYLKEFNLSHNATFKSNTIGFLRPLFDCSHLAIYIGYQSDITFNRYFVSWSISFSG